jgi:membrane protein DedA with SNARE-associated domain
MGDAKLKWPLWHPICVDKIYVANRLPRSYALFALSLLVLVLTLIEAVDAFELPFEGAISSVGVGGLFGTAINLEASLGYTGVFVLMVLESASLPVPSEVVLPLAGYLVSLGKLGFTETVIVASVGGTLGAYIDYYLARMLGRPILLRLLSKIRVDESSLDRAQKFFEKGGSLSVLLGRLVPLLRTLISFPAGLLKMDSRVFGLMTIVGTLAWSALLVYVGYSAGALWRSSATATVATVDIIVVYALLILSAVYVGMFLLGYALRSKGE